LDKTVIKAENDFWVLKLLSQCDIIIV
jgi:hypothetical protein